MNTLRETAPAKLPTPQQLGPRSKKHRGARDPVLPESPDDATRWAQHYRQPGVCLNLGQRAALLAYDAAAYARSGKQLDKRIAFCAYAAGWRWQGSGAAPKTAVAKARLEALGAAAAALAASAPAQEDGDVEVPETGEKEEVEAAEGTSAAPIDVEEGGDRPLANAADAARVAELEKWLGTSTVHAVEGLYDMTRQVRRHLPNSRGGKLAVAILRMLARLMQSAPKGVAEAAEAFVVAFPAILLCKRTSVAEALDAILSRQALPPQPEPKNELSFDEASARALRDAILCDDQPSILRVLDRSRPTAERATVTKDELTALVNAKFRQTNRGEVDGDECGFAAVAGIQEEISSPLFRVGPAIVKVWARRARGRAPDLYGWTGSLIGSMIKVDHRTAEVVAWLASRPPGMWSSPTAANGVWREVKGCLIPKKDGGWRPIAIPHVFRRIWTAAATAAVRPYAAQYCVARGQLGVSGNGAAAAYAAIARACIKEGGTMCTDDRENSFGELDRSAIIDALADFVANVHEDMREMTRARVGALLHRVILGSADDQNSWNARTSHVYPRVDMFQHTNHGLVQGSPESSLIEAIVYAYFLAKRARPVAPIVRLTYHDDGYTATPSPLVGADAFERPVSEAGAPFAQHKSRAFGHSRDELLEAGVASSATATAAVIGIPIGETPETWVEETIAPRLQARISTLRRLATIGHRHLAISTAARLGGPATMSRHFLSATPPSPPVYAQLQRLDEAWLDFWCELCGVREGQPQLRSMVEARVYGPRPDGLGHLRASTSHALAHAEGTLAAIPYVAKLHNTLDPLGPAFEEFVLQALAGSVLQPAEAASAATEAEDATNGQEVSRHLRRHAAERAVIRRRDELRRRALDEKVANRRLLHALAHGARSTAPTRASDGGPLNMAIEALMHPADPSEGDAEIDDEDAGILLSRAFGLPVGRVLVDELPLQSVAFLLAPGCPLCGAAASSLYGRAEGNRSREEVAPTRVWDDRGDHATVCRRLALMRLRRHNRIARTLAEIARRGGLEANVSEKSMLTDGGPHTAGRRPNDVTIHRFDGTRVAAIDVTITTDLAKSAREAEEAKSNKHGGDFANSGALFFPFSLTVQGDVGLGAKAVMAVLASRLFRNSTSALTSQVSAYGYVKARIANSFARGVASEIKSVLRVFRDTRGARL